MSNQINQKRCLVVVLVIAGLCCGTKAWAGSVDGNPEIMEQKAAFAHFTSG